MFMSGVLLRQIEVTVESVKSRHKYKDPRETHDLPQRIIFGPAMKTTKQISFR